MIRQAIKMTSSVHRLTDYYDPNETGEIKLDSIDAESATIAQENVDKRKEIQEMRLASYKRKGLMHMKTKPGPIGVSVGVEARRGEREIELGQKMLNEFKRTLLRKHGTLTRA